MTQYASLSEPDPEWLKIAPYMPSLYSTDVVEFRRLWRTMCDNANNQAGPVDSQSVNVKEHEIIAHGVSIPCRSYVPTTKPELGEIPQQRFPLLLWSYGGGFCFGELDDNDRMLRSLAADLRITCALANAEDISLDVSKGVLVGGLSAGGNLSAVMAHRALKDDDIRGKITGQLLIAPFLLHHTAYPDKWRSELLSTKQNENSIILPNKALEFYTDAYLGSNPEDAFNPDFSPLLAPSFEGLPPTYIQIAGGDPLRDEAFLYDKLLKEAGVTTRVDVYPGVPHAFQAFSPDFYLTKKQDADFRAAINWLLGRTE